MGTITEIMYFDRSERQNTDELVPYARKRMDAAGVKNAVIVWSSGYTMNKWREVVNTKKEGLNVIAVTNPSPHSPAKGTMPVVIREDDKPEAKARKQALLDKGITETYCTILDDMKAQLESEGIKVRYLNDELILGEPLNLTGNNATRRDLLTQFGFPTHIRPLDIDSGADLSMLTVVSQGLRVCVGCTVLCVKSGYIKEGDLTLAIGGVSTAVILRASADPRTCLVKEIIGFERGSSWFERGNKMD